jgi:uncharacterized protein YjbI with pentapeptide repeats
MSEMVDEIPDDRCGLEVSLENIEMDDRWGLEQWRREDEAIYCYRSGWRDGRCIWHADVSDKPIKELKAARAEDLERLDGAILRDADIKNEISLVQCGLTDAVLAGADFTDAVLVGADFTNAGLRGADLTDANLRDATLTDADLRGADLTNADLTDATLTDADLQYATLTDADLQYATFTDAHLQYATFTDAHLWGAFLTGADLHRTDLKNADVQGAEFTDPDDPQARPANLEDSVVEGADLRGADFSRARLFQTVLTDARINSRTEFDATTIYEQYPDMQGGFREEATPEQAAAWVHRRIESLHEENAMSEEARQYHIRKQEAERTHHLRRAKENLGNPLRQAPLYHSSRWAVLTLIWALTNHGESLRRLLGWSAATIVVSAILYPLFGGFASNANEQQPYQYSLAAWEGVDTYAEVLDVIASGVPTFLQSLYFSVITFTTIGYGDLYPIGTGSKFLVGVESLFGAILVALFIFVLGRRVAR